MGGLLFGYDWVVIGGAKPFYELYFGIEQAPAMQGLAMTTANIGCLVGAMMAGAMADRWGRRPLLQLAAMLFTVSAIATGLFNDFLFFNMARLVGGVGIGVASALSPMYIAEVAPAEIRGRLVSLNQMTIVLGILAAQIVNMLLAQPVDESLGREGLLATWNVVEGWRWMFWAETLPAALFWGMSFLIPESPVYLQMKQARRKGGSVAQGAAVAGLAELFQPKYARVLLLGLVIALFQQWCGTNVIFNYAQEIFQSAGYPVDGMFINIVITGVANVVFTFVALYTVERWGRRWLMLIGSLGLGLIYLTLGTCYYFHVEGVLMVVLVVMGISCYAMTLAPVTWVLLSEIFPNRIRGVAMATCTFALWTGCCTLTYTFPVMNAHLGSYGSFWIYAAICLSAYIFLYRHCPETKGKQLEEN